MTESVELDLEQAEALALKACLGVGANAASARALVDATLSAARSGPNTLGFPHMIDYLNSFREGRINCDPQPKLARPFPAFLTSDADGGIAQLGFDLSFADLVEAARNFGIAIFTGANGYTSGELGYYVRRLAEKGLVSLAATNANAMVAANAGGPAVYSTNPMAFGFPLGGDKPPLVIDQSASATAYVNLLIAAREGRPIPKGWAVDADGADTEDAQKALGGALLPFGGRKGANIALMVEMLSAGLSGGFWSLDAPHFNKGDVSPSVGFTVIAMMPGPAENGLVARAGDQAARLQDLGVHVPGVTGRKAPPMTLTLPREIFETLKRFAV